MSRAWSLLPAVLFLVGTLTPSDADVAAAVLDHDHHPGLGHPEDGDGEHHHGDPDDHHESPGSPCHHHDDHTCCTSGAVLGLPGAATSFEKASSGYLPIPCVEPRLLPTARELFHVPLA